MRLPVYRVTSPAMAARRRLWNRWSRRRATTIAAFAVIAGSAAVLVPARCYQLLGATGGRSAQSLHKCRSNELRQSSSSTRSAACEKGDGRNSTRRALLSCGLGGLGCGTVWARAGNTAAGAATAATQIFTGKILQSPNDDRTYQASTLGNGLRVLLVSDAQATGAAAALSVHAGSYLDPQELPGLAHFCEHMLFLGTSDYPQENSFRQFISANGGSQNAFTEEQDTTYFFDASPGALREGLQRFSSFFVSPLFTASATDRELNAIESEDAKNRQSDSFRLNQLQKSFAAEGHPQRKFGTGNLKSLRDDPALLGIDVRVALLDFFGRYYDAGLMALCVVGRESIDTMLGWVEAAFGRVPARGAAKPYVAWRGVNPFPPIAAPGGPQLLEAVPVADRRSVSASWPIVFQSEGARSEWLRSKPYYYVDYLLGHEGENSLLSILKRRGLASRIVAGVVRDEDNFAVLRVSFDVTPEGLRQRDAIFESMYAVIQQLGKGIPDYIFTQCRDLAEVRWRFQDKAPALNIALGSASLMAKGFGPEDYVSGRALVFEPAGRTTRKAMAELLVQLTPERAQHTCVAKELEDRADRAEYWYGTRYALAPISTTTLQRWKRAPELRQYSVPRPNAFVPTDFRLKTQQASPSERAEAIARSPSLVRDDGRWQIFFKADRAFGVPKATFQVFLWLPSDTVAEDAVPSRLWLQALQERLAEEFYDASLAGLSCVIANTIEGISLQFSGYSDKFVQFVEEVVKRIRDFDGPTQEEFERGLDVVQREQRSFDKQQPYQYAAYMSDLSLLTPQYSIEFLRRQAAGVTRRDATRFAEKLRAPDQRIFGQALMAGNLDDTDVARLLRVLDGLPFGQLPHDDLTRVRTAKLPVGSEALLVRSGPNSAEVNNALRCVFFSGAGLVEVLMAQLLQLILEGPFFTRIRTERQLGYAVLSQAERQGDVGTLALTVQSTVASPDVILEAVDAFLADFRAELSSLPASRLSAFKLALVERIVKPDERLGEEVTRWWQEINLFQYKWERRGEEAVSVRNITQADLLNFFDRAVAPGGRERRRLISAVFAKTQGYEAKMAQMLAQGEARGAIIIEDAMAFSAGASKWPLQDRSPEPLAASNDGSGDIS